MKKIGFIDMFIDEWHANNYPDFIKNSSLGNEFSIHMAWEEKSKHGGKTLENWCNEHNVIVAKSIEELVEKCDGIVVLAPSNPDVHPRLSEIPLKSGKPIYIDKPFAASLKDADYMFKMSEQYKTPVMSCSALRFGKEI